MLCDFNIDLLKSDEDSNTWLELIENYQFSQLINEPTRVTNKSRTLIDHILTTTHGKVRCTKVPKIGVSHHYPTRALVSNILAIVDKHAPLKEKRAKIANQPEWTTKEILKKMAECDHYKDIGDVDNYRQTRNRVTNMIELFKTD